MQRAFPSASIAMKIEMKVQTFGVRWVLRGGIAVLAFSQALADTQAQVARPREIAIGAPAHPAGGALSAELTLGAGSSDSTFEFSFPMLFAAKDGGIFVVDVRDPALVGDFKSQVWKYDHSGRLRLTIGRNGSGPGEYRGAVGHVTELADGRIVVSDADGILVYNASGKFETRWKEKPSSFNIGNRLAPSSGGGLLSITSHVFIGGGPGILGRRSWRVTEFTASGRAVMTTQFPDSAGPTIPKIGMMAQPFAQDRLIAFGLDGLHVSATSSRYAVELGRAQRVQSTLVMASAVGPTLASNERNAWRDFVIQVNARAAHATSWRWQGPEIPLRKPVLRQLSVDADGRVWVEGHSASAFHQDSSVTAEWDSAKPSKVWYGQRYADILQTDGKYLGRVQLPDNLYEPPRNRGDAALVARGSTVWAITVSAYGEPVIQRFALRWR